MTFSEDLKAQNKKWDRIRFNLWPLGHCMRFGHRMQLIIDCQMDRKPKAHLTPREFLDKREVCICMN
jgi:hypothetical protein